MEKFHATTVLLVRRGNHIVIGSDGQVTMGNTIVKGNARKVRKMSDGNIVGGFAGSAADGMALFERLEAKLRTMNGQLFKAAVELAKEWRTDKALRRLEALLLVADRQRTLLISGTGEVMEPDHPVAAIGSGAGFAVSAARALYEETTLDARKIAEKALSLAGEICIYTNTQLSFEELI